MKKTKLQKVLAILSPDGTEVDFSDFDFQVEELKNKLKEKIQVKTLEDVNFKLQQLRKLIDFTPLQGAIDRIEEDFAYRIETLTKTLDQESTTLQRLVNSNKEESQIAVADALTNIEVLEKELKKLLDQKDQELRNLQSKIEEFSALSENVNQSFESINAELEGLGGTNTLLRTDIDSFVDKSNKELEKVRRELTTRINNISHGGGFQNRNIAIGGNPSVLSKYTDINLKAGSNVTLTYSNNDTTKQVDVTIASSGGGSSVAGTVRSINRVSTTQTMGSVSGTDYVYIADQGVQLTLPDATGITNLYTIKNIAASSVLVGTTAAQTIDGDSNLILATQYTAVDLVNDGNDNWSIT